MNQLYRSPPGGPSGAAPVPAPPLPSMLPPIASGHRAADRELTFNGSTRPIAAAATNSNLVLADAGHFRRQPVLVGPASPRLQQAPPLPKSQPPPPLAPVNGAGTHRRAESSSTTFSATSSSSSFSESNKQQQHRERHCSRGPSFADPEDELLESWLEVEFQRQFRRLNGLIRRASGNSAVLNTTTTAENDSEILFLQQRGAAPSSGRRSFDNPTSPSSPNFVISPASLPSARSRASTSADAESTQLTSWLMARRAGGGASTPSNNSKCLKSQTIPEEQTFEPVQLRPKLGKVAASDDTLDSSWFGSRLARIEHLLASEYRPSLHPSLLPTATTQSNLICLALTEPNDKANRDTLLYAFPEPASTTGHPTCTGFAPTILKLGGMFITLSEVIDLLRYSKPMADSRTPQMCRIQVLPSSSPSGATTTSPKQPKSSLPLPSRTYLFTILRHPLSAESLMSIDPKFAKAKKPPTILLLVGLPMDSGFTESDTRCAAHLLEHSIAHRFGSVQAAFESYFCTGATTTTLLTANFLHRTCSLFEALLAPVDGSTLALETALTLSNTFFSSTSAPEISRVHFPLRHLPTDDSVAMQVFKLLNFYDSLDWLDEAVARFYRRDSMDLEHALSEHFARCLQWSSDSGTATAPMAKMAVATGSSSSATEMLTSFMGPTRGGEEDSNNNNNGQQPQLFDLLEVELSSFVVVGSVVFYRGLLVESNVANVPLNAIYRTLWCKGFLALTKYRPYDLVYFTKLADADVAAPTDTPPKTSHFLLVLGYGHLVHCSILQVYYFDRSNAATFGEDTLLSSTKGSAGPGTAAAVSLGSLPSSFAFYVFIKESYRFLAFNVNTISNGILDERIDSHLEQSLENIYRLGVQIGAENFSLSFGEDKRSRKALEKVLKKEGKGKGKELTKMNEKRKSSASISETSAPCSHLDSPVSLPRTTRPHAHSVPTTPCKESRPQSLYSNWSYSSNLTASHSSASSLTSLGEASCNCNSDSSTVYTNRSACEMQCSTTRPPSDLLNTSIYRFSHRYLPESLVLYLNIEPAQQLEAFYGPLLDGQSGSAAGQQLASQFQLPNQQQIMASVTAELVRQIRHLQSSLRQFAELELKRQKNAAARLPLEQQHRPAPHSTGQIVTLHYDLITSKRILEHNLSTRSLTVSFTFYLLGQCSRVHLSKQSDEFYAAFKLNSSQSTGKLVGQLATKTAARSSSKWSFGRFSLKLDSSSSSLAEGSTKKKGSTLLPYLPGFYSRANDYELNRLDYLQGDFEEIVQTVRRGAAKWL